MRILYNSEHTDRVKCFNAEAWKQERNLIYFKHLDSTDTSVTCVYLYANTRTAGSPLATYTLDANKEAVIDVTDYIRAYPSTTKFIVECQEDSPIEIQFSVVGLVNPANMIIPANGEFLIAPPSVLIDGICDTVIECYGYESGTVFVADESVAMGRSNVVEYETESFEYGKGDNMTKRIMRQRVCGCTYAAVRWMSTTGVRRCHTMQVVGVKSSISDTFSLVTHDNSFNKCKGFVDGFTLLLDGLTPYDYWYYSDMVKSSSVEVSFDSGNWQQVDVVTSSVSIPSGNNNKLEIEINYKQYDAVTL